jgi:hypothetical protein
MIPNEYRLLFEGIVIGALIIWIVNGYFENRRSSRKQKSLIDKMNAWRDDKLK